MVEVLEDPAQVPGPVAVGVREAPWIDLVDDAVTPVRCGCGGHRPGVGHRASLGDPRHEGQTARDSPAPGPHLYSGAMTDPTGPSSRDRIRVGVAGLGAVAQAVHLPLLARHEDVFEIAAIADLSPSLRTALGERYRVPPAARHE